MPNHVHLILVPQTVPSLSKAMGRGHEMYSRYINFKKKWRGLLWQSRYHSFPMDESHLYNAARYVELNPVRAGLTKRPEAYPWSSAKGHLRMEVDPFFNPNPLWERVEDWNVYLDEALNAEDVELLRRHQRSGRPLGSRDFIDRLERLTGRELHLKTPGPKKK